MEPGKGKLALCAGLCLLFGAASCGTFEADRVKEEEMSKLLNPPDAAGTIVYYLPRTDLQVSMDVELEMKLPARCLKRPRVCPGGKCAEDAGKTSKEEIGRNPMADYPTVVANFKNAAVKAVTRPDPDQAYYVRVQPGLGRDSKLTIKLAEDGTLIGAAASREDKVLPGIVKGLEAAVKLAVSILAVAGPDSQALVVDPVCTEADAGMRAQEQHRQKLLTNPKEVLGAGGEATLSALLKQYDQELARHKKLFEEKTKTVTIPVACLVNLPGNRAQTVRAMTVSYDPRPEDARENFRVEPKSLPGYCRTERGVDPFEDFPTGPQRKNIAKLSADLAFHFDVERYPRYKPLPAANPAPSGESAKQKNSAQVYYWLPQLTDYRLCLYENPAKPADPASIQETSLCPKLAESPWNGAPLFSGFQAVSQWGRLASVGLKALNDGYEIELYPGSGALKSYSRAAKAPDVSSLLSTAGELAGKLADAADPVDRLKHEGDRLEQEARLRKLRKEAEAAQQQQAAPAQ